MELGLVRRIDIDAEMQQSYLDYAMSVIVARAIPDARDGLKPVHRRILYAMHAMGMRPDSDFKKSARIVGEVLGKFHPHGDMAVYDAMARMAQGFSMRYPLIEGQGNFGSVDGDPPAAMRYTEARLARPAMEMLADLDKNTVDFEANFDGSLSEPSILPAQLPNLLINGATGIAVGMSTSIPPHNLREICDALIYMLGRWTQIDKISLDELLGFVQGPDFPTGGIILRGHREGEGLLAAYGTGRGKITVQARAHVEEMGRGRSRVIVTELPFQTNKASLIEKIAELAREGRLEGISDLRDESDREGMRIVIELAKSGDPDDVISKLYQRTPMQTTFSMITLALVEGQPRLLNLKHALRVYLEHRLGVVRRRSEYELARARERSHILEGLRLALQNLDEVIELIRKSKDVPQAHSRLQKRFKLSDAQVRAILNMPLRQLASLERKQIEEEYKQLQKRIRELEALLGSEKNLRKLVAEELERVKEEYGDRRRTLIVEAAKGRGKRSLLTVSDLAPAKDTWVVLTAEGKISRTPTARLPRLAGRSAPRLVVGANTQDTLYLFQADGAAAAVAVATLPETDDAEQGTALRSATPLEAPARVAAGLALPTEVLGSAASETYLVFATRGGMVKKSALEALPGPSARAFQAVNVADGDELGWVQLTRGRDEIALFTRKGMGIRFSEDDVRPMGLAASGVMGIRLEEDGDAVIGMGVAGARTEVLLLDARGLGKRTALSQFPRQGRYGKGVLAWRSGEGVELAGAVVGRSADRAVARLARYADRSIRIGDAPRRSRTAGGEALFEVKGNDRVSGLEAVGPRPDLKAEAPEKLPKPAPKRKGGKSSTTKKGSARRKKTASKGSTRTRSKPSGASKSGKRTPTKKKTTPRRRTSKGKP